MENHIILTTVLQHTILLFTAPRRCNSLLPYRRSPTHNASLTSLYSPRQKAQPPRQQRQPLGQAGYSPYSLASHPLNPDSELPSPPTVFQKLCGECHLIARSPHRR